jgi:hypothetical protein
VNFIELIKLWSNFVGAKMFYFWLAEITNFYSTRFDVEEENVGFDAVFAVFLLTFIWFSELFQWL